MIEVLIVGAGSVGLMTALGLAREGISVTSRDRRFRRRLCVHMTKTCP
jgi:2-polyprenyl-6-methoxyphenol hydroxylase-like FAD-dependent oxidoreductase